MPKPKEQKRREARERLETKRLPTLERNLEERRSYWLTNPHEKYAESQFKLALSQLNKTRWALDLPKLDEHGNKIL
jgi:hypothetical protein